MKIGNVIASSIALCWGLAVVFAHLAHASASHAGGSGAYSAGRSTGFLFALLRRVRAACGLFALALGFYAAWVVVLVDSA